jgi:hypothetical protein
MRNRDPSDIAAWSKAAVGRKEHYVINGATHYLAGQPALLDEVTDHLEAFVVSL